MTAAAAGIGERSVYNVLKEYITQHNCQPPKKYPPNASNRKAEIQAWLAKDNIQYGEDMVEAKLLSLIKENETNPVRYAVDEIIEKTNRTVLKLPPYHCELSPIESIWARVKGYVSRCNTTFMLADVKTLLQEAINIISGEN